jgi:hypothetical protein
MPNMTAFCLALVFTVLTALAALSVRSKNHHKGGTASPSGGIAIGPLSLAEETGEQTAHRYPTRGPAP